MQGIQSQSVGFRSRAENDALFKLRYLWSFSPKSGIIFSFKELIALVPEYLQSVLSMAIEHASMPNGTHDPMSLTLYSANPDEKCEKTPASASVPPEYLLPSGHPDVREL